MLRNFIVVFVSFILQSYATPQHGVATFGTPKYTAQSPHFDYVNPKAPKGGSMRFAALGTFDNFNPFIVKGVAASGLDKCYATLLARSLDEPASGYGYVAETVEVAPDLSWVIFNLNPKATFADGSPMTADDVIFSFNSLKEKGVPMYRTYYKAVQSVEKLSDHAIKFHCPGNKNKEIPVILGQLPVLSQKYFENLKFDETSLKLPLCSGPYTVKEVDPGRFIAYERIKNWWGDTIFSQRGLNNFDVVRYDYYRDSNAMFEAFKTGQVDYRYENTSRLWAIGYDFPAVEKGTVVKKTFPVRKYGFTYGIFLNTRKPFFQNRLVRQALTSLFDFEWANKNLFYGLYSRNYSYFADGAFDSYGKLEPAVKKVLETYAGKIPAEALTDDFTLPKFTSEAESRTIYNTVLKLLKEAGWVIRGQKLVNEKTGEPLQFELLIYEQGLQKVALHYKGCLEKIGITLAIRMVDVSSYIERLEKYDFDSVFHALGQSPTPGNEQRDMWTSQAAKTPNSRNVAGIADPVVDDLVEKMIEAQTYEDLTIYTKALDRVLLFGYYMVPGWKIGASPVAYWDKFSMPETLPSFEPFNPSTWWFDAEKNKKVQAFLGNTHDAKPQKTGGFWGKIKSFLGVS